jgi:hypothetical protein
VTTPPSSNEVTALAAPFDFKPLRVITLAMAVFYTYDAFAHLTVALFARMGQVNIPGSTEFVELPLAALSLVAAGGLLLAKRYGIYAAAISSLVQVAIYGAFRAVFFPAALELPASAHADMLTATHGGVMLALLLGILWRRSYMASQPPK